MAEVAAYAQMWRISDDVWDYWKNKDAWSRTLYGQFELEAAWSTHAHAGRWPDADMLPIGYLGPVPGIGDPRFAPDERRTAGDGHTLVDGAFAFDLGSEPNEVGRLDAQAADQSRGISCQPARSQSTTGEQGGDTVAWTSEGEGQIRYLALFNLGDTDTVVDHTYEFYNLPSGHFRRRELWTGSESASSDKVHAALGPHSCVLYQLQP